ncbi:MAG TPA: hypothetical protein VFT08_03150 [Pyrinomonadaceae bacterium]|nr:hypothetical protein [Pyrinomonadaceae bacterium]
MSDDLTKKTPDIESDRVTLLVNIVKKLDKHESILTQIVERLGKHETILTLILDRLEKLTSRVEALEIRLYTIDARFESLERTITRSMKNLMSNKPTNSST